MFEEKSRTYGGGTLQECQTQFPRRISIFDYCGTSSPSLSTGPSPAPPMPFTSPSHH